MCFRCELRYWERQGDIDLENGDYVVLNLFEGENGFQEEILTFSNIKILRMTRYADDAASRRNGSQGGKKSIEKQGSEE